MTRWIYDLDGTLVRTRAANLAAYREVGVEPPPDFDVRPWQEWCSPDRHARKALALPRHLARTARVLPAYDLLTTTGGEILTNASPESYQAIVAVFPLLGQYVAHVGFSPAQKLAWLLGEQRDVEKPGVVLDDNSALVERIRSETRWQGLDTSGF